METIKVVRRLNIVLFLTKKSDHCICSLKNKLCTSDKRSSNIYRLQATGKLNLSSILIEEEDNCFFSDEK